VLLSLYFHTFWFVLDSHLTNEVLSNGLLSRGCLVVSMCRTSNWDVPGSNTSSTVLLRTLHRCALVEHFDFMVLCTPILFGIIHCVSQQKTFYYCV